MNWPQHYKEVRERITRQPTVPAVFVTLPKPPPVPAPPPPPPPEPRVMWDKPTSMSKRVRVVIEPILQRHDLTWAELWAPTRPQRLHQPRREVWAAMRGLGLSYPRIGQFTGRDHSTVVHGLDRLRETQKGAA